MSLKLLRNHVSYRMRWQREVGLLARTRSLWLASKPRCDAESGGFVSVGIIDILPALHVLLAGLGASVVFLIAERCTARLSRFVPRCKLSLQVQQV